MQHNGREILNLLFICLLTNNGKFCETRGT